jgi:hypothetical protein
MLTIYGDAACKRSDWRDLCCNPNRLGGNCTCCYPDDEIYPELEGAGWKYFGYWFIGAALTITVHLIAIHLFGVRHGEIRVEPSAPPLSSGLVEVVLAGFDLFGAALPVVLVGMMVAWVCLEDWDERLIRAYIKRTSARSARFYLTMALCAAYGLGFGFEQWFVGYWFFDYDAGIPAIIACFYGVAIGLHHTSRWANWSSVDRCRAVYPLM